MDAFLPVDLVKMEPADTWARLYKTAGQAGWLGSRQHQRIYTTSEFSYKSVECKDALFQSTLSNTLINHFVYFSL